MAGAGVRLARIVCIQFLTLVAACQTTGVGTARLEICSYGAERLAELDQVIMAQFAGSAFDIERVVNRPSALNVSAERPVGQERRQSHLTVKVSCEREHQNTDQYMILVLLDRGRTEAVQTLLFYEDQDFALRGEGLNAARYGDSGQLHRAVASVIAGRTYTRGELEEMMYGGGFITHLTSEYKDVHSITYARPLFDKESMAGKLGYNTPWILGKPPVVEVFVHKKSGILTGEVQEGGFNRDLYLEQNDINE